jgi:Mg/Co/Ni transporter MgtE
MMSNETALTLTFLGQAPATAARELQSLEIAEAAALIESVPARLSAPVLNHMIPRHAASLLVSISAPKAAGVLRQLSFADSISLTRLVTTERRDQIFEALPTRWARRLKSGLQYPQYQVGAWVDPEAPILGVNDTVTDALRVLMAADSASHIFVESDGHERYVGVIPVREILRADTSAKLQHLTIIRTEPVSNRATLSAVAFDDRWDDCLHLPVVGRRGNLLGGLSKRTLRRAIHEQHTADHSSQPSLIRDVTATFGVTCLSLIRLVASERHSQTPDVAGGPSREQ